MSMPKSKDSETKKKKPYLEARSYPVEVRILEEGEIPKIEGYAAVFNQLSDDLGGFREKIKRGFFKDVIESDDVRALFNPVSYTHLTLPTILLV